MMLVGMLAGVAVSPAAAEVSAVSGSAYGYYTNVGLFGGPRGLRGHGTTVDSTNVAYSPWVTLPGEGSATPVTAHDPDGASAQYGPAVIFGGKWPDHVSRAPASGPLSVSTQGTVDGGSVTSSAGIVLHDPPNADVPGGIGPGPLVADEAHSTCTADESGVRGSATFLNGILETKYDRSTQLPIVSEAIPVNPPPNYTRSGTIDHVGDNFTIVLNEQIIGPDSITVNAAHMYLLGPTARGDMVVGSSTCSLSSTIPNTAPVAADEALVTDEDTPATGSVLGNDTDPDGDPLTAANAQSVFVPGENEPSSSRGTTYTFPSVPPNGSVSWNPDGSFTYTPDPDFHGTDSFAYVARDPRGSYDTGDVTITVNPVPDAPQAADDAYATYIDTPLSVPAPGVLANDTDGDGDPLTAGSATDPDNGSVTLAADGSYTYTAEPGFEGTDTWSYVASDGTGLSDTAVVTIKVRRDEAAILKDINPGPGNSAPANFTQVGDTVFFRAANSTEGVELWKSDGTADGTVLVKNLNPGNSASNPANLTASGDTLYFTANNGSSGVELWKSDGTADGTVMVEDIRPGGAGSNPGLLTVVGDALYFTANDGAGGVELWRSDGTADGTAMVKDINPGTAGGSPGNLTLFGDGLYFTANDGVDGTEPWRSDGTADGTVMVKDMNPGAAGSNPGNLRVVGNTLYLSANNGTEGDELWKSDGTVAGTVMVKDIRPGALSGGPANLRTLGDTLFFTARDATTSIELWKSDGTEAGTVLVKDINPGSGPSSPIGLTALGDSIYFTASNDTNGRELWKSDGTEAGTTMVRDINPGAGFSSPNNLTVFGDTLYFTASNGIDGTELWRTDGTEEGTELSKDIRPGAFSSSPSSLTFALRTLFFAANDGTSGIEPHTLTRGAVSGQVVHVQSGGPIADATVIVTDSNGDEVGQAVSDIAGRYIIEELHWGEYTVTATHPGFQSVSTDTTVRAGRTTTLDVTVKPKWRRPPRS